MHTHEEILTYFSGSTLRKYVKQNFLNVLFEQNVVAQRCDYIIIWYFTMHTGFHQ